ncbi:MAG: type II and III secretion system protein family protein [Alphaproteobacteria bacterium]|nr:MAG: type II and III secretion system protein family protein [Alphaproteobacteria bacterium]
MSITRFIKQAAISVLVGAGALVTVPAHAGDDVEHFVVNQGDTGQTKRIVLSLDKGAIVELPTDARDVLASNPTVVDAMVRTQRRIYIIGKKVGQANVFVLDSAGKQILNLEVQVERDVTPLENMLKRYLPNSRIEVSALNDRVVLTGFVPSAAASAQAKELAEKFIDKGTEDTVVNLLAIDANEQVMLKVRIVEMQRSVSKQFGMSWEAFVSPDGNIIGFDANGVPLTDGSTIVNSVGDNPFSLIGKALSNTAFTAAHLGSDGGAAATLSLMERTGLVKTLAEPTLTAISGEAANFLAGGEFPVPTGRDRDGNVNITFKKFGVGLGFTPVVLDEGRISLRISTEVSELASKGSILMGANTLVNDDGSITTIGGINIPALRVRRAESTVELPSGGSLVMAGLLQENSGQTIDGLPGAKDVPVLGALFRSRDFQSDETELVIIVTPYLVNPVNERELKTPADGFAPPSDLGTILLGRLNSVYGVGNNSKPSNWQGPVGHIVE